MERLTLDPSDLCYVFFAVVTAIPGKPLGKLGARATANVLVRGSDTALAETQARRHLATYDWAVETIQVSRLIRAAEIPSLPEHIQGCVVRAFAEGSSAVFGPVIYDGQDPGTLQVEPVHPSRKLDPQ